MKSNLLTLLWLCVCPQLYAQTAKDLISLDVPQVHDKKIKQNLLLRSKNVKDLQITIDYFDCTDAKDTILVYHLSSKGSKRTNEGIYQAGLNLLNNENGSHVTPLYKDIVLKNGGLPAGDYKAYVSIKLNDSLIKKSFYHHIDSSLSIGSRAKNDLDNIYSQQKAPKLLGTDLSGIRGTSNITGSYNLIKNSANKINKAFNRKGYTVSYREGARRTFVDLHYQGRYIGYYEIDMNEPVSETIKKQKARLQDNIGTGVTNELENSKTVLSQIKKLYEEHRKKEVNGDITVSGNAASGQEEYSESENNYYEVAGQIQVPVLNIPITLEGYYTSQDKNRIAKASYLRVHYDTEQAKEELLKLISSYNNKYTEGVAKGKGLQGVYHTYLSKLQQEKEKLWSEVKTETGIANIENFKTDTSGLLKEITANYETKLTDTLSHVGHSLKDSSNTAVKAIQTKDRIMQLYGKAIKKYQQIQELEVKAQKYYILLEQYENNSYFDSVLAYDRLKDVSNGSAGEMTYKQLVKSASNLLPDGKAKEFITGVTHLDAGIINKEVSSYTLNGQTIKGIDLGYDLGFCETEFTYGRVEYVNREGQVDKYNGYSGRASFKPGRKQKATLIYYGYIPSKRMLREGDFFDDVDVTMPGFKDPIHIVSVAYTGQINKYINVEAEGATSFRAMDEYQKSGVKPSEKVSYRVDAEGSIPNTTIDVKGGYEHIGKQFENNSLPLNLSGTDKYTAGAKGQFFKNFLTLGVEYYYLIQQNLASRSAHSKWGFDLKTTSKRYPSVSLSYKPFTTFRSFADTFSITQRPILGEVWLGKLSYQIKRKTYVLRLTAVYNRNTALTDTIESNSNIAQLNALFTSGKLNLMLNVGQTNVKATQISPVHGKTNFLTIGAGYVINEQWNINGGQDIGVMKTGLSRYAANIGCGYRFKNTPLTIQTSFRYNTYKIVEGQRWKQLYGGRLDVNWRFRFKIDEKA